ncbi:helix-hairpin-helix domain-containing protein [Streptomyces sp. 2A115]|uniref:helix-hairpin-helix domain-containing protein n=1 Tax=Streptomyces sp. 2A115 TaxID=3457439 RepID=UPI003FD4CE9F
MSKDPAERALTPAAQGVTRLLSVHWTVGRTGLISPRGVLEPVEIDGSTVGYADLHTPSDIAHRDLRIGDQVLIGRAGGIVLRLIAPLPHARTGAEQPVALPTVCPQCGADIDRSERRWRCVRGRKCGLVGTLAHAVGRDQLDIGGLGVARIQQLVDGGLVQDIGDLFTLDRDQLLGLARLGESRAERLLEAVEQAKTRPLAQVLRALGIRGIACSLSVRIAWHFGTMEALREAEAEEMQRIEGVGPDKADILLAELAELTPVIDKLVGAGVTMTEPGASASRLLPRQK